MEGVNHNVVMSANVSDRFEVFKSLPWFLEFGQEKIYMQMAVETIFNIIIDLIGNATTENIRETHSRLFFPRLQRRYTKAVTVSGWSGIGKERVVKYTTMRVMHAKLFDTLIWMIGQGENLSLKNFQRLVAEGLKIPLGRDDDDDSDDVDKVVSDKISLALRDVNFLLVHDGGWGLDDLRSIGIPYNDKQTHSMILVASNNSLENHQHVSFDHIISGIEKDLVEDECKDIVKCPRLQKAHINITPKAVMECIIYFAYLLQYMEVEVDVQLQMMRYWVAGFIGDATLDLETIFKQGNALLDEIHDRSLIKFVSAYIDKTNSSGDIIIPCTLLRIGYEKLDNPKTNGETDGYRFFAINSNPTPEVSKLTTIILCPLSSVKCYKPFFPENIWEKTRCVRVLSFMSTTLSKLPSSVLHLANSIRFLNLRNCKNLVQVPYLSALVELQMLDLSNTSLEELPSDSFENLQRLRLLDLTGCVKLSHLPSSISCLLNLEQLLLGGCSSLNVLPSHILPLEKLQMLDLSRTILAEIPEQFFRCMISLKDLNLSFNSHLISLPKSISNLTLRNLTLSLAPP